MNNALKDLIEQAWNNRELLKDNAVQKAIRDVVDELDCGRLRIAEKGADGWHVNEWLKKAVILYFPINQMEPSYVNIGAYVDSGTMVDTWATVGSCAQIGKHVHLSGGVGIGGVLEPVQAAPVIIEDHCFIGSRCIVVEGVIVEEESVLGANTVITASTHIIDVTGPEPVTMKGRVPARSIVIPGSYTRHFPAGDYQVNCALIIGRRTESTDKKTSLNNALRDFGVSV